MYGSDLYGFAPSSSGLGAGADLSPAATSRTFAGTAHDLINPDNPLVWVGVVMLVTVGAAGVAGSVRLGRAKLSASLGEA